MRPLLKPPRRRTGLCAAGNKETKPPAGDDSNPLEQQQKRELNLLIDLVVRYPAVRGTFAVLLGYFLHVSPLATLRWSLPDMLPGLQCAVPIVLLDGLVMLPKWEPQRTSRTIKMLLPRELADRVKEIDAADGGGGGQAQVLLTLAAPQRRDDEVSERAAGGADGAQPASQPPQSAATAVAERPRPSESDDDAAPSAAAAKGAAGDLVEVERTIVVRADQHPLRDALHRTQIERTLNNPGRLLSPASEAALLALVHLSEEMLYRGVLLAAGAQWATDRLYEAGADDVVALGGGLALPTAAAGAVLAATALTAAAVALVVQQQLFPLRLLEAAGRQLEGRRGGGKRGGGAKPEAGPGRAAEEVADVLAQIKAGAVSQQRWSVALAAANEGVQWGALSAAFLLSGGCLTAPLAASVASDALFSGWQRLKAKEVVAERRRQSREAVARLKRTKGLAKAVAEHRKARLHPPPAGAATQLGQGAGATEKSGEAGSDEPAAEAASEGAGDSDGTKQ